MTHDDGGLVTTRPFERVVTHLKYILKECWQVTFEWHINGRTYTHTRIRTYVNLKK